MATLKNMNVWIAGGCGLIGRAIVRALSNLQANVFVVDFSGNGDADYNLDITNSDELERILDRYWIECWINCTYPIDSIDHFQAYLDSSIAVAEHMREKGGIIINFSSIYGVVGSKPTIYQDTKIKPPSHGYSACKGAIVSLTRSIATSYGRHGVRANCISPGGIYDNQDLAFARNYNARVPLGRMATTSDILPAILYLITCDYVTGQNLIIDGGLTAW